MKLIHFKRGRSGFTLIELMVVVAILSVFLMMSAVVSRGAIDLSMSTRSRVNSERNAAAFLNQFGSDVSQRIDREETPANFEKKPGNDEVTLFTQRQGYAIQASVANRSASLVSYRIRNNRLERAASGYGFGSVQQRPSEEAGILALGAIPNAGPTAPVDRAFQVIAEGVIRIEYTFLVRENEKFVLRAGVPTNPSEIEAVITSLVILDPERSRTLDERQLASIADAFPDAVDNALPTDQWKELANNLAPVIPGVRKDLLRHVRVYQGMFTFGNHPSIP